MRRLFLSKWSNFGTNFADTRLMHKTSVNIVWHEPNEKPVSSVKKPAKFKKLPNFLITLIYLKNFSCCKNTKFQRLVFLFLMKHFCNIVHIEKLYIIEKVIITRALRLICTIVCINNKMSYYIVY